MSVLKPGVGATLAGILTVTGTAYIGDTTNANVTLGLTINQGAADDTIVALKSSDVDHGVTTIAETDTFGLFAKTRGANGGLKIVGLDDGAGDSAMEVIAIQGTTVDTTKTTAGRGVISIRASLKSGTGVAVVGANGNLLTIDTAATTRFIFDQEGDFHADSSSTTF